MTELEHLKALAEERGIRPCHEKPCDLVAIYSVVWLGQRLYYCEEHTAHMVRLAGVFGMSLPKTRIPLPEAFVPSRRFEAIGLDLINDEEEEVGR